MTRSAQRDRDAILSYLVGELKVTDAASRFLDELNRVLATLPSTPKAYPLSRERHLRALGYRFFLVMRYVVLYKVVGDRIVVVRVFHGSQDYARLVTR